MQVILSDDKQAAIDAAAQKIADTIAIDTWLFVSGGSSFAVFKKLDQLLTGDQKQVTKLLLVDERYGPEGHKDSNWNLFGSIETSKYSSMYPVLDDTLALQSTADEYDQVVGLALESDSQTIAILGAGADKHVAGIKPMDEKIFSTIFDDKLVAGYIGPDFERITLTPSAISQLDMTVAFIAGLDKAPVVAGLAVDAPLHESPVHVLTHLEQSYIYNVT